MPKASLSTCHVEFNVVWQCGETWLNLVIITTPAPISTGGTEMFSLRVTSSRGHGVYVVTITLKYTLLTINLHMLSKISIMHFEYILCSTRGLASKHIEYLSIVIGTPY